MLTKDLRIFD